MPNLKEKVSRRKFLEYSKRIGMLGAGAIIAKALTGCVPEDSSATSGSQGTDIHKGPSVATSAPEAPPATPTALTVPPTPTIRALEGATETPGAPEATATKVVEVGGGTFPGDQEALEDEKDRQLYELQTEPTINSRFIEGTELRPELLNGQLAWRIKSGGIDGQQYKLDALVWKSAELGWVFFSLGHVNNSLGLNLDIANRGTDLGFDEQVRPAAYGNFRLVAFYDDGGWQMQEIEATPTAEATAAPEVEEMREAATREEYLTINSKDIGDPEFATINQQVRIITPQWQEAYANWDGDKSPGVSGIPSRLTFKEGFDAAEQLPKMRQASIRAALEQQGKNPDDPNATITLTAQDINTGEVIQVEIPQNFELVETIGVGPANQRNIDFGNLGEIDFVLETGSTNESVKQAVLINPSNPSQIYFVEIYPQSVPTTYDGNNYVAYAATSFWSYILERQDYLFEWFVKAQEAGIRQNFAFSLDLVHEYISLPDHSNVGLKLERQQ